MSMFQPSVSCVFEVWPQPLLLKYMIKNVFVNQPLIGRNGKEFDSLNM